MCPSWTLNLAHWVQSMLSLLLYTFKVLGLRSVKTGFELFAPVPFSVRKHEKGHYEHNLSIFYCDLPMTLPFSSQSRPIGTLTEWFKGSESTFSEERRLDRLKWKVHRACILLVFPLHVSLSDNFTSLWPYFLIIRVNSRALGCVILSLSPPCMKGAKPFPSHIAGTFSLFLPHTQVFGDLCISYHLQRNLSLEEKWHELHALYIKVRMPHWLMLQLDGIFHISTHFLV